MWLLYTITKETQEIPELFTWLEENAKSTKPAISQLAANEGSF